MDDLVVMKVDQGLRELICDPPDLALTNRRARLLEVLDVLYKEVITFCRSPPSAYSITILRAPPSTKWLKDLIMY
jgi:hypothetical protein